LTDVSGLKRKTVYLEVSPVGRYAFGSDEKGDIQIWAAGRSGWFELVEPATEYATVHEEMIEAVKLWHAILDNTKLQNASGKDIFVPFMKKKDLRGATAEDVFRRHATFIIEQMKKSLASWSKKPLYQYVRKLEKDTAPETIPQLSNPPPNMTSRQREVKKRGSGRPVRNEAPERPQTPPNKKKAARTPVDELNRIETEAAILWKFLQLKSERIVRAEKLNIEKVARLVHSQFIFDDEKQAASYVRFQGKYLIKAMQERRNQKTWGQSQLYHELMETILTQNMIGKMAKIVLQVRQYALGEELAIAGLDIYASSDEEIQQHHSKSALRPKSGGKGKSYTANMDREEENLSSGSLTPRKRKDANAETSYRRSKRRALSVAQSSDRSSIRDDPDQATESDNDQAQTAEKTLPLRWKDSNAQPDPAEEVPFLLKGATLNTDPNAPGDVWHCNALGCMQTIYGATSGLGQRLIDDHIYEHQELEERPPQLSVVMNETKKTNLPVS